VWPIVRFCFRQFARLRWWQQGLVLVLTPLITLNVAVASLGHTLVSPLSPFYLSEKCTALEKYLLHRPLCLLRGDGDLTQIARDAEKRERLPAGLMQAIISVESDNCAHRISYAGAMGPAQLMPDTAAQLGVKDPFDPKESIDAGARYMRQLLDREKRVELAVAAYNAGPGNVNGRVPDIGQTQVYVAKVMRRFASLRG
jgi:soluble lytic murein transglycosylase-like protein